MRNNQSGSRGPAVRAGRTCHRYTKTSVMLGAALFALCTAPGYTQNALAGSAASVNSESLLIQPGDTLTLKVLDVPELEQTNLKVTDDGNVPLLLLGNVHVGGLTPAAAAAAIAASYMSHNYLRNAHISVSVDSSSLSDATVFGYVIGATSSSGTNGVSVPLTTATPLLAVLARAGGFSDRASRRVTIQRRDRSIAPFTVDLPNRQDRPQVDTTLIYPGDTVVVPRAGTVYVLGHVNHSSAVLMTDDGRLSLLQALSQVGSPMPAASSHLRIFRKANSAYQELDVDLGKIEKGRREDVDLQDEDVIWVPFSYGKNLLVNGATITAAVAGATATGIVYTR